MNSILPPLLAPYIQQCTALPSLTLLTSVLDTPTNWLLGRFLHAALHHVSCSSPSAVSAGDNGTAGHKVILFSAWRSQDLWAELLRKIGFNLEEAINAGKVVYIDGLATNLKPTTGIINLSSLSISDLSAAVTKAMQTSSTTPSAQPPKTTILLDGLDFLLAANPTTTTTSIQTLLLELQSRAHNIVLTCAGDSALLHNTDAPSTPLELDHATLARHLAYQARWVFQLRPLETGQSKEVSGSVRVSRGGSYDDDVQGEEGNGQEGMGLGESEWLYHWTRDGGVRVWGRGET